MSKIAFEMRSQWAPVLRVYTTFLLTVFKPNPPNMEELKIKSAD